MLNKLALHCSQPKSLTLLPLKARTTTKRDMKCLLVLNTAFSAFKLIHLHLCSRGKHFLEKHQAWIPSEVRFHPHLVRHSPPQAESMDSITTLWHTCFFYLCQGGLMQLFCLFFFIMPPLMSSIACGAQRLTVPAINWPEFGPS